LVQSQALIVQMKRFHFDIGGYVRIRKTSIGWGFREEIKKALTVVAQATSSFQKEPKIISCWAEDDEYIGVPRGYYNQFLKRRGVEGEIEFSLGSSFLPTSEPIKLRDGQEQVISEVVDICRSADAGGAIIKASVGTGKTVMSLEAARRLGGKTLVVVYTSVLMEQWKNEIPKFFPDWKIGTLQADKIDVDGKDVVVGMLQTLYQKEYNQEMFSEFGTIIFDEVHLLGSEEFGLVLRRFSAKNLIGVSGTLERKDKAERAFIYSIGPVVEAASVKNLDPEVFFIDTKFAWSTRLREIDRARTKFISTIPESAERNEIIIRQACKAAQSGRAVLVLTERVAHAKSLGHEIDNRLKPVGLSVGVVVGETKKEDREIAYKANVLVATIQLIATGFNEPRLDTLIFATPYQSFTQAIGRIRRLHPNKKQPFVLDLVDTNSNTAMILAQSRFKKYLAEGWKLHGLSCFPREFLWKYKSQLQAMK
jgi:superfamily II DNA or RNA helicase